MRIATFAGFSLCGRSNRIENAQLTRYNAIYAKYTKDRFDLTLFFLPTAGEGSAKNDRRRVPVFRKLVYLLSSLLFLLAGLRNALPAPEPDPAGKRLAAMDTREKLLQLFLVTPEALTGENTATEGERLASALRDTPVGGIVLFTKNLVTSEQTRALTAAAAGAVENGLLIGVDEEGGTVNRLMSRLGTTWVGPMYDYRAEGPETARENARTVGEDLRDHGFNLDFAPVADVWTNPANTVIGRRAYSDDPREASRLVAAAVEGFHEAGVLCTLKHFPGHGDTSTDSHTGAALVDLSLEELEETQLPPFAAGIEAGADLVMVGHLTVPALDAVPATVSRAVVTDLLREELGFEGAVITDALNMSAVSALYEPGELALRALEAGVDILLMPEDLPASLNALESALESGELTMERVDESVRRVLTLKARRGLIPG